MGSGGVTGEEREVMIGWNRTEEERGRAVQKGLIQEERNERRMRE